MKKFTRILVFALIAIVFLGTFVYLYQRSRPKVEKYEEVSPTIGDLMKTTIITGKIVPRDEVNIKPQISGIISELYKEAGEQVKEDEVIAKVKVIPEMGSLSSAQSRVRLPKSTSSKPRPTSTDRKPCMRKNWSAERISIRSNKRWTRQQKKWLPPGMPWK